MPGTVSGQERALQYLAAYEQHTFVKSVQLNISHMDMQQDLVILDPTNNIPHSHNNQVQAQA